MSAQGRGSEFAWMLDAVIRASALGGPVCAVTLPVPDHRM